jgi:hypothetical protein
MIIQYERFGNAMLGFSPDREDRELMLQILKTIDTRDKDTGSLIALSDLINNVKNELVVSTQ